MVIFLILSFFCFFSYFFIKNKLSPEKLFLGLWFLAIAIGQLRLSKIEVSWSLKFWLIILSSLGAFTLGVLLIQKSQKQITFISPKIEKKVSFNLIIPLLLLVLLLLSFLANFYIFSIFHTFPLFSSDPDKLRFVINKKIFGLFEYAALFPRLAIPLGFFYIFIKKKLTWKAWFGLIFYFFLSLFILLLYTARINFVFASLIVYFLFLTLNLEKLNFQKIFLSTLIIVFFIGIISAAIPAIRHSISYRDYPFEEEYKEYKEFAYLAELSSIKMPPALGFLTPAYLAISFNFQALQAGINYFGIKQPYYLGKEMLANFNPLWRILKIPEVKVKIPWSEIFLPWWVTGTYLFTWYANFGFLGILLGPFLLGLLASFTYVLVQRKNIFGYFLLPYLNFVLVLSLYTNYFSRPELYLDLLFLFLISWVLTKSDLEIS